MNATQDNSRAARVLLPLAAFFLPLVLYVLTACRDIYWMDTTEFMLCGRFLYLSHPPGYPLLTLLLRLISLVPVLTMPFRMNLISSLAATGSCLFAFLIVRKLTKDALAGLFAALVWGFSYEVWSQATVLEVYTLNVLLISVAVYALVTWAQAGRPESLLAAAFAFGLGLANHLTAVLWLPGLLVLAWTRPLNRLGARLTLACMGFLAAGPLLYLCVPFFSRSSVLVSWGGVSSLKTLIEFVSGRTYQYRLGSGVEGYIGRQIAALPWLMGKQFLAGWVFVIPGVAWCFGQSRRFGVAVLFSFVLVTCFAVVYDIPDKEGFFLPAYLAAAMVCGTGFAFLRRKPVRLPGTPGRLRTRRASAVAIAGFALLVLPLVLFYHEQDRHQLRGLRDLSESLLSELPRGSVLFTDDYSTTRGMGWLAAERGDNQVLVVCEYLFVFPWYLEAVNARAPVPERAFALAAQLWQSKARGFEFGELARDETQQVKRLLVETWIGTRPLYWMPRDFHTWAESWHEFSLKLHGLTYRLSTAEDSCLTASLSHFSFTFPGPGRYRTDRFHDAETQDLCRRFAAFANRRGILRFSAEDNAGAVTDFNLALDYFPGFPSAIENKGIVFYYSNQPDSAKYYLNVYLEHAPDNQEVMKVRSYLNKLGQ